MIRLEGTISEKKKKKKKEDIQVSSEYFNATRLTCLKVLGHKLLACSAPQEATLDIEIVLVRLVLGQFAAHNKLKIRIP